MPKLRLRWYRNAQDYADGVRHETLKGLPVSGGQIACIGLSLRQGGVTLQAFGADCSMTEHSGPDESELFDNPSGLAVRCCVRT